MIDGLYSAATGMNAQQARIDAISNDLANASTTGYKSVRFHFNDLLNQRMGHNSALTDRSLTGAGVQGSQEGRNLTDGAIQRTDRNLDVAITGQGFLAARDAQGRTVLTRDGNLQIDARGRLATSNGLLLNPQITVPANADTSTLKIAGDGTVSVDGRDLGRIRLMTAQAPEHLRPIGANDFVQSPQSGALREIPQAEVSLTSGALEGSNVDTAQAMSDMIESQRAYDLSSRAVRTWDDLLSTANQIRR